MTNKSIQVDEQLKSMLHINGCQQRTAGYNEAKQGADGLDTDDMERLEKIAYDEVLALLDTERTKWAEQLKDDLQHDLYGHDYERLCQALDKKDNTHG